MAILDANQNEFGHIRMPLYTYGKSVCCVAQAGFIIVNDGWILPDLSEPAHLYLLLTTADTLPAVPKFRTCVLQAPTPHFLFIL